MGDHRCGSAMEESVNEPVTRSPCRLRIMPLECPRSWHQRAPALRAAVRSLERWRRTPPASGPPTSARLWPGVGRRSQFGHSSFSECSHQALRLRLGAGCPGSVRVMSHPQKGWQAGRRFGWDTPCVPGSAGCVRRRQSPWVVRTAGVPARWSKSRTRSGRTAAMSTWISSRREFRSC